MLLNVNGYFTKEVFMKDYIANFLNYYADDIDNNEFIKVYAHACGRFSFISDIGELTRIFEEAGINPLNHISVIPRFYYSGSNEKAITIKGDAAKVIFDEAFAFCPNLESVLIPNQIRQIGNSAFTYCDNLKYIQYDGTYEEFRSMNFEYKRFLTSYPQAQILCMRSGEVLTYRDI